MHGGPDAVLDFLRRFGSIQYDPIAVAGRSHDIVLHARIAGYEPAWCDGLYERREIFEAVNKGLSFVLASDYPWFRGTSSRQARRVLAENAESAERVLERLRVDGPLSALDFERQHGETVDWFGVKTNVVRAVLEAYTVTGVLGLARRDGNRRYYDLIERLLPKKVLAHDVPLHDQLRHKMLSRYRAHGLLGGSSGGDVFGGLGPAKPDPRAPGYPGRTALREQLIEDGELVPVEVDGSRGKRFVVRDEVELLAAPPEPPPSVAFLSPFDPLVWDRALLAIAVRVRLRVGPLPPAREAALRLLRPPDRLPRPLRRPHRAEDRPFRRARAGRRPLVGGRLHAAARRRVRRCDALGAPRVRRVRRRGQSSSGRPTSITRSGSS